MSEVSEETLNLVIDNLNKNIAGSVLNINTNLINTANNLQNNQTGMSEKVNKLITATEFNPMLVGKYVTDPSDVLSDGEPYVVTEIFDDETTLSKYYKSKADYDAGVSAINTSDERADLLSSDNTIGFTRSYETNQTFPKIGSIDTFEYRVAKHTFTFTKDFKVMYAQSRFVSDNKHDIESPMMESRGYYKIGNVLSTRLFPRIKL